MNTALLVIDFINDIVNPLGKIPSCAAQVIEKNTIKQANKAIHFARSQHWLVLPIKVGFSVNYAEMPKNSPIFSKAQQFQALALNQWGTEFDTELAIASTDCVIIKHRVSPFHGTQLDLVLKTQAIERLVVCGVSSAWAIQAAAREGHDRDYSIVILENACAAASEQEHGIAMEQLARIATIIHTDALATL